MTLQEAQQKAVGDFLVSLILSRIIINSNGCWEYSGAVDEDGYGNIRSRLGIRLGRSYRTLTHRAVFGFFSGESIDDFCVLHHCDNPPCSNPQHLYKGTRLENGLDIVERNRRPKGESAVNSVLTEPIVSEARRRYSSGESIACLSREWNIHYKTLYLAVVGTTWKCATTPPCSKVRTLCCSPNAILTADDVHVIRRRVELGESRAEVARAFHVAYETVNRIVKRITWSKV